MSIRVSIVEDDDRIREGIAALINGSDGYECISAYGSAEEALKGFPLNKPEVILMDINLPGMSGIQCIRKVKEKLFDAQIIMLTIYEDGDKIYESLRSGANGYLLKRSSPVDLLQAISDVIKGGSPMSSQIARKVVQTFRSTKPSDDVKLKLTDRENEILKYLSQGFRYKEIGDKLCISPDTVHTHLRKIYEKLQVRSRTEAVVKYLKD